MGIETILIVFGVVVVIAIVAGARCVKHRAVDTQGPKTDKPSSVQRER